MRVGKNRQPLTPKTKKQILDLVKQYGTGWYCLVLKCLQNRGFAGDDGFPCFT